jgi:addiction module HigA family antidote
MGEYFVKRPLKRPPFHPGEILREDVLPTLGLSVSEAARRLGISRQQLHRVLACTHPITTDMALEKRSNRFGFGRCPFRFSISRRRTKPDL